MAESALYKKIEEAICKKSQAGDEEAVALMTAAVVTEIDEVSAISAHITGFFKAEGSP
jgi:phage-related baseplate assembly protein